LTKLSRLGSEKCKKNLELDSTIPAVNEQPFLTPDDLSQAWREPLSYYDQIHHESSVSGASSSGSTRLTN